jgi:hypothetical protein
MTRSGAIVCLLGSLSGAAAASAGDRGSTPTYTNQDLERVAPYRGETGVLSKPAMREEPAKTPEPKAGRGEAYWRREAERLRTRLRPLVRRAEELRQRLQEPRADDGKKRPRGSRGGSGSRDALAQRLASIEAEIREREDELRERARRERALPGWLR